MKALSLKQPWAELILLGKKTIETRTWNTTFRGRFLIHASLNVDKGAMERFGFSTLPLGCVVGEAELVSVKEYANEKDWLEDADKHCAGSIKFDRKRYGYLLKNVKRVKPKPCKGRLGFWDK
jgi:predicted transcriptional regulator